jgi:fatty-acyl-CoA synthase
MKYAFMSSSCPQLSFAQMLALAMRFGYEGIEPRAEWQHAHGVELSIPPSQRRTMRQLLQTNGIALCCIATGCRYADGDGQAQQIQQTLRYLDLAADLGCPRIRVFGGPVPQRYTREQATELVVTALRRIAPHAEDRGITVCLETHDDWSNPDHCAQVMRQVNHPSVAVTWDVMHPVRQSGWTIPASYEVLRPWVRHVHFHDGTSQSEKLELRPVGQGRIDHRQVVRCLLADQYPGFLSGEWINWEPYAVHLPRELATMRDYELTTPSSDTPAPHP